MFWASCRTDQKHLCLAVKEKLRSNELHIKWKGVLDTVTGTWDSAIWLHRNFGFRTSGAPLPRRRGDRNQGLIGLGALVTSSDRPDALRNSSHLNARCRAQWQLGAYEWLQTDVEASYNPPAKRVSVKLIRYRIMTTKDCKETIANYDISIKS